MHEPSSSPPSGEGSPGREGLPEKIGAYGILSLLGRGGMGEVFLAWDPRLKRRVAIKRIRQDVKLTPIQRERLLREGQAVASISHPSIVHVNEMLPDEAGNDCIVMEYVEGPTLAAALAERGPWHTLPAVRLAREVASGLAAAHAGGIIHRDLKTENVILTFSGHAKILDFGLAKPIVPVKGDLTLTELHCVVGTCRSMSPEQARQDELDERSDLFSLGVLLYEMLTGEPPFHGSTAMGTLAQVLSHHPPRVDTFQPEIPQRLSVLVASLLEKDPACRPQSAEEVIQELATIEAAIAPPLFPSSDVTISERPTGYSHPRSSAGSVPVQRSARAPESTAGMSVPKRHWPLGPIVLAVLVMTGLGIAWARMAKPQRIPVLRVRVLEVKTNKQDEESKLAAFAVLNTALNTLNSFEKVEAIDATQFVEPLKAKAGVEDESLVAQLDETGGQWKVTFSRERAYSEPTTFTSAAPQISTRDLVHLSQKVSDSLSDAYLHQVNSETALAARNEDYVTFLKIKKRVDLGKPASREDLADLENIMVTSPTLLEARLLTAEILLNQYQTNRDASKLTAAQNLMKGAEDKTGQKELLWHTAHRLSTLFKVELESNAGQAERTLQTLAQILHPDSPRFLSLRGSLKKQQQLPDEAFSDLRRAADFSPTWRNILSLVRVEEQLGRFSAARIHIKEIHDHFPQNAWALKWLARLESGYGDAESARQLYQELNDQGDHDALTNLGVAQILSGQYKEATASLRQALEVDKDNVDTYLALGEAELAQGLQERAQLDFQTALEIVKKRGSSSAIDKLVKAQCLAYLGENKEAMKIVRKFSMENLDGVSLLYVAQVYAIVGDRNVALDKVSEALERGVALHWLRLPAFDSLRKDPNFCTLVDNPPGASISR